MSFNLTLIAPELIVGIAGVEGSGEIVLQFSKGDAQGRGELFG